MEKIVQLRESEYDKLFLLANANEKLIQEAAEERWKSNNNYFFKLII